MAKMNLMTAALVAAAVVAGCCDKKTCTDKDAQAAETAPAAVTVADGEQKKDPNAVVLSVNGKTLTQQAVDEEIDRQIAAYGAQIPAEQLDLAKKQIALGFAQQFIMATALTQQAEKLGYTLSDEEFKAKQDEFIKRISERPNAPKTFDEFLATQPQGKERALEEFRIEMLINKMIESEVMAKDTTDYLPEAQKTVDKLQKNADEIKAANAEIEKNGTATEADTLKKITELKAELDNTPAEQKAEKFAALAKEHSACPSKEKGGDLGKFQHGMMVPEFDKAAFEMEVGQISEPVKTQFGYHLIMVTAKEEDSVQASHILLSTPRIREVPQVPKVEDVVNHLKRTNNRKAINDYVLNTVRAAEITAEDDYKQILPPPEKPAEPVTEPAAQPAASASCDVEPAETPKKAE